MRIAIVGTRGYPYVYGGYETLVSELSVRLVRKGHSVVVYCHRSLFKERPRSVDGVELRYTPAIERKTLSQFSNSMLSTLGLFWERPDVVLYANPANGPFGLLTKLGRIPSAINVDGLEWLRPKWRGLGAKYFRFASWLATKVFDVVITDCSNMARIYDEEFRSPSTVIAYGAPIQYSTNPQLIQGLGLSPGSYYLVVARLVPDNNGDLIVRGFERTGTNRKLVILGDVPYRDDYARRIRETADQRVMFPGYVRDKALLRELYCNCCAYIHGHEFGGTNPSLVSALGNGCAILALDTVFSREVLSDGKYGRFFSKNAESLREAIDLFEGNPEEVASLRETARDRIRECYAWEHIADQYEAVFKSMMK